MPRMCGACRQAGQRVTDLTRCSLSRLTRPCASLNFLRQLTKLLLGVLWSTYALFSITYDRLTKLPIPYDASFVHSGALTKLLAHSQTLTKLTKLLGHCRNTHEASGAFSRHLRSILSILEHIGSFFGRSVEHTRLRERSGALTRFLDHLRTFLGVLEHLRSFLGRSRAPAQLFECSRALTGLRERSGALTQLLDHLRPP